MEYSHQNDIHIYYLFLLLLHVSKGQFTEQMRTLSLSLFASSLFILHYRILFKGAIVASKPIKALCLVTCKWFPEDYWLRLAANFKLATIQTSNWSCAPQLKLVWSSSVAIAAVNPAFLVIHSCSYRSLVRNGWKKRKKTPHLMGLRGFYRSTKHIKTQ